MKKHNAIALGALLLTSIPLSAATLVKYDFNVDTSAVGESAAGVVTSPLAPTNGSVIPEPSSLAMLAAAGLFAAGRRSRR